MNKLLALTAASLASAFMVIPAAHAAVVTNTFNVTATLTSQCEATNNATQTVSFGTYVAFQPGAKASEGSATLAYKCTRGFFGVPAVTFDVVGADSTALGIGVVPTVNLQYALTSTPGATVAGTAATSGGIGSPDTKNYVISGSMPADQAGNCGATSCSGTDVRQLVFTY